MLSRPVPTQAWSRNGRRETLKKKTALRRISNTETVGWRCGSIAAGLVRFERPAGGLQAEIGVGLVEWALERSVGETVRRYLLDSKASLVVWACSNVRHGRTGIVLEGIGVELADGRIGSGTEH
jgi:hypothetical protein